MRSAVFGSSVCGPKIVVFVTMGGLGCGKGKGGKGDKGSAGAGMGKGKGQGAKGKKGAGKEVRTVKWWAPRERLGN